MALELALHLFTQGKTEETNSVIKVMVSILISIILGSIIISLFITCAESLFPPAMRQTKTKKKTRRERTESTFNVY